MTATLPHRAASDMNVVSLRVPVCRGIIIHQENEDQWTAVAEGVGPDEHTSICGIADRETAEARALAWGALTGLPVMSRPLSCGGAVAWWGRP